MAADFSPDGIRVATGSHDKTARIWNAETGEELVTLTGHTDFVESVAFSPDGSTIVTGSDDRTAKIWDVESGQELGTLKGHVDELNSVSFSPDGARIVTAGDRTARVWDAVTGTSISFQDQGPVECCTNGTNCNCTNGVNTISWVETDWPWSSNALGVTFIEQFDAGTGAVYEMDLQINGRDHDWDIGGTPNSRQFDLKSVLVHELGHTLTFDDLYNFHFSQSTMFGYISAGSGANR